MNFWKNKKIWGPILAGFVLVIMILLIVSRFFEGWQLSLSNNLYGRYEPSKDIIIVAVDQKTIDELGPLITWSRSNYADVLANLNKFEPKVVAFDYFFLKPRDEEGDARFFDELTKTANYVTVLYVSKIRPLENNLFTSEIPDELLHPSEIFLNGDNGQLAPSTIQAPDPNMVIRSIPVALTGDASSPAYDTFPIAIAKKFTSIAINSHNIPHENGQLLINYSSNADNSEQGGYTTLSFIDVMRGGFPIIDPSILKDKIVLIGSTANSLGDIHFVPSLKNGYMPGVEIHANAIQTILEQRFLRNMTMAEKILLVAVLTLISVFVFLYTKIRWSLVYLFGVGIVYTFAAPFAFDRGLILDLVHPYLAVITVFFATYMYRYVTEFKDKMALKSAFSRYVNPGVVDEILKNPDQLKLGGEKREVTVIFTDIEHFTTTSEMLKPESLVALLNEYFEAMCDVIMSEGGTLDKFEGDAIVAFFGAPLAQPDHAIRACNASLKMRTRLGELMQKWKTDPPLPGGEKKPDINFRCGISSGEVIVGNIGSSEKLEYTVIGDIVNLGSRLEGQNKEYKTNIMISEATWESVKNQLAGRELDIITVAGKKKPVKVYEIFNHNGHMTPDLLKLYNEGIQLYRDRKFTEGLEKFNEIIKVDPDDGPSTVYRQRCEIFRDFPPPPDWDGVFKKSSK